MEIKISKFKKITNIFFVISFIVSFFVSPGVLKAEEEFDWVRQLVGADENSSSYEGLDRSIITDSSGNIYITGIFYGTVDFDPSDEGVHKMTSQNGSVFILKLSSEGTFVFAYELDSESGSSQESSITLDREGNIYIGGFFLGTVDFDPSDEGVHKMTSQNRRSAFLLKLSNEGTFISAYELDSESGESRVSSITLDPEGNIYTVGYFYNTIDFDPNEGMHELTSVNYGSVFLLKLSSEGTFMFADKIDSICMGALTFPVALDQEGNIYIAGNFYGTADFDPGVGEYKMTSQGGTQSAFLLKLSNEGTFISAYELDSESGESEVSSITIDSKDNIYIGGSFQGTVDFDPSDEGLHKMTPQTVSAFLLKLSSEGTFMFADKLDSDDGSYVDSIDLDQEGNIYTLGDFSGTIDLDPSDEGIYKFTSGDGGDSYILKLDSSGNFLNAYQIKGGDDGNYPYTMTVDSDNNVYVAGEIYGTSDMDPSENEYPLTAGPGGDDAFILKLSPKQQEQSTPIKKRTHSSGSSVGVLSTFYQEQYQRALATGVDTTPYLQALNQLSGTSPQVSSGQVPLTDSTSSPQVSRGQDHRTLKQGMQGNDVKELQIYLNTHGYVLTLNGAGSLGNETTTFGLLTKLAVIKFQLANKLVGDGIVGLVTWSYIK